MNIAVTTDRGAFYDQTITLNATTVSSEYAADTIQRRLEIITKGKLNRVNSISTDTCSPMLKTLNLLQSVPQLRHIFIIPCDPHSIQLLIKDICEHFNYAKVVEQANEIIAHFKGAKKQYQILKALQRKHYNGKALALIMACNVR
jgi:hypothetical protein